MPTQDWIEQKLRESTLIPFPESEKRLANAIFDKIPKQKLSNGKYLAAAFDLLMAAEYYRSVTVKNWHYCPLDKPKIYYAFLNACPYCCLKNEFKFSVGNKPQSGSIGKSSTFILALVLNVYFEKTGARGIEIKKSIEPVDIIIIDEGFKFDDSL